MNQNINEIVEKNNNHINKLIYKNKLLNHINDLILYNQIILYPSYLNTVITPPNYYLLHFISSIDINTHKIIQPVNLIPVSIDKNIPNNILSNIITEIKNFLIEQFIETTNKYELQELKILFPHNYSFPTSNLHNYIQKTQIGYYGISLFNPNKDYTYLTENFEIVIKGLLNSNGSIEVIYNYHSDNINYCLNINADDPNYKSFINEIIILIANK